MEKPIQPAMPSASPPHWDAMVKQLAPEWQTFFEHLGPRGMRDLDRRTQTLARQVRDNGITYNVYANHDGPQRPWALDLFPLIITPERWAQIESGVLQRTRLLECIMADVYGPQQLIRQAMLPPALVQGHPGYLRAMHGVTPVGGTHLHIAAFDLACNAQGQWAVVSQRTQAPSGLGYLLENRLLISRQFPQAYENMHIQRLAATYRGWVESLKQHSPEGHNAHVALLTPGPYNETYFEHAYLARYLGLSLVEGSDLTVRDERVYLRTLRGLEPVHVLLKRLDDEFLDPLELRADSTLGIPGLLQAVRAGHVVVANAPGSAFLESPALLGFLPALSEALLGETLQLPSLDTWWCGEHAAMTSVLPQLPDMVIKPTYSGAASHGSFEPTLGLHLTPAQQSEWVDRITRQPNQHTLQAYSPLSHMPTWKNAQEGVVQRSVMLRVFALRHVAQGTEDAQGVNHAKAWRVLPGGLARLTAPDAQIASMQRGGSSADVWVQTQAEALDHSAFLHPPTATAVATPRKRIVTRRAAENLYWLGRYTQRSENCVRLMRLYIDRWHKQAPASAWGWLHTLAQQQGVLTSGVPAWTFDDGDSPQAVAQRHRVERNLIAALDSGPDTPSVGFNLRAMQQAASSLRERLSPEHWNAIVQCVQDFSHLCQHSTAQPEFSFSQALLALDAASTALAAISVAQTERMARDEDWQLLTIGRLVERLEFLSTAWQLAVDAGGFAAPNPCPVLAALLALCDGSVTLEAQHHHPLDSLSLIERWVHDNQPGSLTWVTRALQARLFQLADTPMGEPDALAKWVPDVQAWPLEQLCHRNDAGQWQHLTECLNACKKAAWQVSDAITARYFSHSDSADSVGA